MFNIAVIGESNKKYINRLLTGEYSDNITKTSTKIYTNVGIFEINFTITVTDDTDYIISIYDDGSDPLIFPYDMNNTIFLINYRDIPSIDYDNRISIRCNYKLLYPVIQIIRQNTGGLNIYQIESPAVETPCAEIEEDMLCYKQMLDIV